MKMFVIISTKCSKRSEIVAILHYLIDEKKDFLEDLFWFVLALENSENKSLARLSLQLPLMMPTKYQEPIGVSKKDVIDYSPPAHHLAFYN